MRKTAIALLVSTCFPASAQETPPAPLQSGADNQFIQIESINDSEIFDLKTVRVLLPGRFVIDSTQVDHPDVMRFETRVLLAMSNYCGGPDGRFEPSPTLLTLGPPDMPVRNIEVSTHASPSGDRVVEWEYPYKRLAFRTSERPVEQFKIFFCRGGNGETTSEMEVADLARITNGTRHRTILDCDRAMFGLPFKEDQDVSTVPLMNVRKGSEFERTFELVCARVTGTLPPQLDH